MIKKFKIYSTKLSTLESKKFENKIEFENKSFWLINGDYNEIIEKLEKLLYLYGNPEEEHPLRVHSLKYIISSLKNQHEWYKNIIGLFLFLKNKQFKFWSFDNTIEKDAVFKNNKELFNFKGEIKIENDNIVLDTLKADIMKYNL